MRRHAGLAVRVLFGLGGVAFLVITFLRTWDPAEGVPLPAWWRLGLAVALFAVALASGFRAWARLLGAAPTRGLASGFYLSQFGKYMPGGVWHAVGQVGYATRSEVRLGRAAAAFGVFAITQAAAGGALGAAASLLATAAPGNVRLLALGGVLLLVLLDRRWMTRVLKWMPSRIADGRGVLVPEQRAILTAAVWSAGSLLAAGCAFAVILNGIDQGAGVSAVPAFTLAWTVGFLALPFPSGVGVREAALIALLGAAVDTSSVIAASVLLRLVGMVAEAGMAAGHTIRPLRSRATPGG